MGCNTKEYLPLLGSAGPGALGWGWKDDTALHWALFLFSLEQCQLDVRQITTMRGLANHHPAKSQRRKLTFEGVLGCSRLKGCADAISKMLPLVEQLDARLVGGGGTELTDAATPQDCSVVFVLNLFISRQQSKGRDLARILLSIHEDAVTFQLLHESHVYSRYYHPPGDLENQARSAQACLRKGFASGAPRSRSS